LQYVAAYLPDDGAEKALEGLGLWSQALRAESDRSKAVLTEGVRP
jgi:hypothetical protein